MKVRSFIGLDYIIYYLKMAVEKTQITDHWYDPFHCHFIYIYFQSCLFFLKKLFHVFHHLIADAYLFAWSYSITSVNSP